jgi:hypothetical protein
MRAGPRPVRLDFFAMTSPNITDSPAPSGILIRFVTDGLIATIDSYRSGQLPLHRFSWELCNRIDSLAELHAATRAVTRLRWLHRDIDHVHAQCVTTGRAALTADEENALTVILVSLRTALAALGSDALGDSGGAARPANPAAVAIAAPGRRHTA